MSVDMNAVKTLRERSGAGIMDCKRALVEANGDIDTAHELLRKSGAVKAGKRTERITAEGTVAVAEHGVNVALAEVNCETDFVGKSDGFTAFASAVADKAAETGISDVDALLAADDALATLLANIRTQMGEHIVVRRIAVITTDALTDAVIGHYIHGGGRIGVAVLLTGGNHDLARDLAMHIAALQPVYIDEQEVPAAVVDKERDVLREQAAASGKPAAIVEKMVDGGLRKFFAEHTLLGQAFVKEPGLTVAQLLARSGAVVQRFIRFAAGEGIEKVETDFVGEVMSQVKK